MFSKAALALLSGFVTSCVASQVPNCPPCGSGQTQLSQAEAQQQLDLHNQFRHAVHGTTDHDLEWNCELMCQAQVVGDTCTFQHSGSYGSAIQAGENLATGTDGELASWLWFQEYTAYDVPQYKAEWDITPLWFGRAQETWVAVSAALQVLAREPSMCASMQTGQLILVSKAQITTWRMRPFFMAQSRGTTTPAFLLR